MADHAVELPPIQPRPVTRRPAATLSEGVRLAQEGRLNEARAVFERIIASDPQNANAFNNLGILYMQTGEPDAGIETFARARKIDPLDPEICGNYVNANMIQGNIATRNCQYDRSIPYYRNVLSLRPDSFTARVNLTNALAATGTPAVRDDFVADRSAELGTHALIACMPKSGSSLLKEALCRLTGWPDAPFSYAYLQNEQELYLPNILAVVGKDTVTQQHCRATEANIQILQGLGIRPLVLVRNLFDIVMSLSDFFDAGAAWNSFVGPDWANLDPERKRDFIIDHVMPWYLGFYVSWRRVAKAGRLDCLIVHYEDMVADKPGTLASIADFLGLDKTPEDCCTAIAAAEGDKYATRFNRGVAGRGESTLSEDQKARLRRLTTAYSSIDFSPVGL